MNDDISKLCADFLRANYEGLKASHARELVAGFFGYKSHAALLADTVYPIDEMFGATILIPDWFALHQRQRTLTNVAPSVHFANDMEEKLADFLVGECIFEGEVWHCSELGDFIIEEYLPEHLSPTLDDELFDVIDSRNAVFEDIEYETASVEEGKNYVTIVVAGKYSGYSLDDESDGDEIIEMEIFVTLPRWAGRIAFGDVEIDVFAKEKDEPRKVAEERKEAVT